MLKKNIASKLMEYLYYNIKVILHRVWITEGAGEINHVKHAYTSRDVFCKILTDILLDEGIYKLMLMLMLSKD